MGCRLTSELVCRSYADPDQEGVVPASYRLFTHLAEQAPLTLILDDLHWADDRLLDYLEDLVHQAGEVPLFVIATARPELLARRPFWGSGAGGSGTITLDPLTDGETTELVRALLRQHPEPTGYPMDALLPGAGAGHDDLLTLIGGNPRFAVEYVDHLRSSRPSLDGGGGSAPVVLGPDPGVLPLAVHRIIAARLDTLSAAEKSVLQDAAVLGDVVCEVGVTAISGLDHADVVRRMRLLESREFLRRIPGRPVHETFGQIYAFRHCSVRQVAYGQLPRGIRADKHFRAATWLKQQGSTSDDYYAHHYDNARAAGRTLESSPS
jgi:predicted ATPase